MNLRTRFAIITALLVLVFTQVMNILLVPYLAHAALTLSIGLGALLNALWLLQGLRRNRSFVAKPGWGMLMLRVALGPPMSVFTHPGQTELTKMP